MHRSTLLLATVVTALAASGRAALAGGCDPGTIAAPASFDGAIRPALAEDVDPAEGVVEVYLTAREAEWGFGIGSDTQVWTYNGVLPGPTIEAGVGDTLIVHLCNDLPEDTTIHWHGVETPADMDGSNIAQLTVPPGGSFRYEFPLLRAGTFWYHPHVRTHVAVEHGLYGLLIVRDPAEDRALDLPEREHLVVLDDVLLDPDGEIHEPFTGSREDVALEMLNGREGPLLLLNGVNQPTLTMEKGVPHRVRVLNAANARFQRVSVPDHPFWRIGGDQGLLEAPIRLEPAATSLLAPPPPTRLQPSQPPQQHPSDPDPTTGLLLTPGERADFLFFPVEGELGESLHFEWHDTQRGRHSVDFLPDGTVVLAHEVPDGSLQSDLFAVIQLTGDSPATEYEPPETLRPLQAIDVSGAPVLHLTLGHTLPNWDTGEVTFFIQAPGKPFPVLTPNDVHTVTAGGTYVWEVRNLTGGHHNFHTHGWSFQHLETRFVDLAHPDDPTRNYVEPASHLEDKDTFLVQRRPGTVPGESFSISRFAVTFDDTGREGRVGAEGKVPTATRSGGWLAHCHILEHSGRGMMTFFQVADVFTDGFESGDTSSWSATSPQRFGALAPALASTSHGIKTWTTPPPPVVTTVRLPRSE
jgi:FtsP/CotA-like multicopper oxidase with cupredoxin domain